MSFRASPLGRVRNPFYAAKESKVNCIEIRPNITKSSKYLHGVSRSQLDQSLRFLVAKDLILFDPLLTRNDTGRDAIPSEPNAPPHVIPSVPNAPPHVIPSVPNTPPHVIPSVPNTPTHVIPSEPNTPTHVIPSEPVGRERNPFYAAMGLSVNCEKSN